MKKIFKKISLLLCFVIVFSTTGGMANSETVYPYTQTFRISAYYSPLPCQTRYYTGNYKSEIRLNGSGVAGADGTGVYAGMIAAPRTYQFGTKIHIPGIGMTAIHDRGGAIVAAGERNQQYDRLDVWMGYGDKGLDRALRWGKRNIEATVYGVDSSIKEEIVLPGYSPEEAIPNDCVLEEYDPVKIAKETYTAPKPKAADGTFLVNLSIGSRGQAVSYLQEELRKLNFYRGEITGIFGEVTEHAVFKFQQSQGILSSKTDHGAGVFGPMTRGKINKVVSRRNYRNERVAKANNVEVAKAETKSNAIAKELGYGVSDPEVYKLQKVLKELGYFEGVLFTDYFGESTKQAVLKFQLEKGIVSDENDQGAGRVGPSTLKTINSIS